MSLTNIHGVNTPAMANFKLSMVFKKELAKFLNF